VCLWIVEAKADVVHVVDEYVQPARTVEEHIGIIESGRTGSVTRIACDPAAGRRTSRRRIEHPAPAAARLPRARRADRKSRTGWS
jgi:hypothetical protein